LCAPEEKNAPRERPRTLRRGSDLIETLACRRIRTDILNRERRVADDRRDHVVELVRDAARERAECLQLL
jgi:hypothetical protein